MKLTLRQIETLTEEFDGTRPDWRTPGWSRAKLNARGRLVDGMTGYRRDSMIDRKSRQITVAGLTALKPHYGDQEKIDKAIAARRTYEDEIAAAKAKEEGDRAQHAAERRDARNAKLAEGYRRILGPYLADSLTDVEILALGDKIAAFESNT